MIRLQTCPAHGNQAVAGFSIYPAVFLIGCIVGGCGMFAIYAFGGQFRPGFQDLVLGGMDEADLIFVRIFKDFLISHGLADCDALCQGGFRSKFGGFANSLSE